MARMGKILGNRFLLILSFFALFSVFGTQAQTNIWSFEDNPQPQENIYTIEEKQLIEDSFSSSPLGEFCKMNLSAKYSIYNNHYPDFQTFDDEKTRFKNWKLYLVKTRDIPTCEPEEAHDALEKYIEKHYNNDFYFCGGFSRKAQTENEIKIFTFINELIDYVEIKPARLANRFIMLNKYSAAVSSSTSGKIDGLNPLIKLNSDVEYFLRKSMELGKKMGAEEWDVLHLLPFLNKEKISFLDGAVANRDFSAVLGTTAPCE